MDSSAAPNDSNHPLSPASPNRPAAEYLPPVQPPSASFIMQLFLVPGLIVVAVIGVWALFGQLSSGEQDWRQLISEIRSTNDHRRWRGANALANVVRADSDKGAASQKLAANPEIAKELANLLQDLLQQKSQDQELITQQLFVVRALGFLDSQDIIFPPLMEAALPTHETFVRADAIKAMAIVSSRASEQGRPVTDEDVIARIIDVSNDENPMLRQVGAYSLGLFAGDAAGQRLRAMTEDSDLYARVNAATALARRKQTDGLPVLIDFLKLAPLPIDPATMDAKTDIERKNLANGQESINGVALVTVFKSLRDLSGVMDESQKQAVLPLCESIAKDFRIFKIRVEANETVKTLKGTR